MELYIFLLLSSCAISSCMYLVGNINLEHDFRQTEDFNGTPSEWLKKKYNYKVPVTEWTNVEGYETIFPIPGAMFQYDFEKESCSRGYYEDNSEYRNKSFFGELYRGGLVSCSSALHGVHSSLTNSKEIGLYSSLNSRNFVKKLKQNSGFSFEIWFMNDPTWDFYTRQRMIASISTFEVTPYKSDVFEYQSNMDFTRSENEDYWYELRTHTQQSKKDYRNVGSKTSGPERNYLDIVDKDVAQLIISVNYSMADYPYFESEATWMIRGRETNPKKLDLINIFDEKAWNTSYHLQLFSDMRTIYQMTGPNIDTTYYKPWYGSIKKIAMYPFAMKFEEAVRNWKAGIKNNIPTIASKKFYCYEEGVDDGEEIGAIQHFQPPFDTLITVKNIDDSFFRKPLTYNQLVKFEFPEPYDEDERPMLKVNDVYFLSETIYSNFTPYVYIATLPEKGTFYYPNGTEITVVPSRAPEYMHYRPLKNEFCTNKSEPYATFQYVAVDGKTGEISAPALGEIYVQNVNDPPIPLPFFGNFTAGMDNLLCVHGTDLEYKVRNALIKTYPLKGTLYKVKPGGFLTGVTKGSIVMNRQMFKENDILSDDTCVYYVYDGEGKPNENNVIGRDKFKFAAVDTYGMISIVDAWAEFDIYSPMTSGEFPFGAPNKIVHALEDKDNFIRLYAKDVSPIQRVISFTISGYPRHGDLIDPATGKILHVGNEPAGLSEPPHILGVNIIYRPHLHYFNNPNVSFKGKMLENIEYDEFSYFAMLSMDKTYRARSVNVTLVVHNVNDKTNVICPNSKLKVNAAFELAEDEDFFTLRYDRVFIKGFRLDDIDSGLDLIRVTVTAEYGYLSISPLYRSSVDFMSRSMCFAHSSWSCVGTGQNNQELTFIATPKQAELALNGLRYQCYRPNVRDSITITVYDGSDVNGGPCLDTKFMGGSSGDRKCFVEKCSFEVAVSDLNYSYLPSWYSDPREEKSILLSVTTDNTISYLKNIEDFPVGTTIFPSEEHSSNQMSSVRNEATAVVSLNDVESVLSSAKNLKGGFVHAPDTVSIYRSMPTGDVDAIESKKESSKQEKPLVIDIVTGSLLIICVVGNILYYFRHNIRSFIMRNPGRLDIDVNALS